MSRTKKGSKPAGYEFWSRRPQNGGRGRYSKTLCHRIERRQSDELVREEVRSYATE